MKKLLLVLVLAGCTQSPSAPVVRQHTDILLGQPCVVGDPLPEPYFCQDQGNGRGIVVTGN